MGLTLRRNLSRPLTIAEWDGNFEGLANGTFAFPFSPYAEGDRSLREVIADVLNVKNPPYSAKGDGTTDDTTALEAWRDAAATLTAAGTPPISVFPEGTYITTTPYWMKGVGGRMIGHGAKIKNTATDATNSARQPCFTNNGVFHTHGTGAFSSGSYLYGYKIATTPLLSAGAQVCRVDVTAGGSGYTADFAVTGSGGAGSGFAATAGVKDGAVQVITITNPGSGYTSVPTMDLSAGAGSGATATAQVGVLAVTCSTVAEAANIDSGDWCLVYGYASQDSSHPPRPRYFEFVKAAAAGNATTGLVILDRPLNYRYRSDWWDFVSGNTSGRGAARILPLTRSDFKMIDFLEMEGFEFLENPNYANGKDSGVGTFNVEGYQHFIGRRLKIHRFATSSCNRVELDNCQINEMEADKIVNYLSINGTVFKDTAVGGTGCQNVDFNGCEFQGETSLAAFHSLSFKQCKFSGIQSSIGAAVAERASNTYIDSVLLEDCEFVFGKSGIVSPWQDSTSINSITVAASPAPTATLITVDVASDTAAQNILRYLQKGSVLRLNDYSKSALVKDVYAYDSDSLGIEVEMSGAAFSAADVLYFTDGRRLEVTRPKITGAYAPRTKPIVRNAKSSLVLQPNWSGDEANQTITITERDLGWPASEGTAPSLDIYPHGYIKRFWLMVHTLYTGDTATARLQIRELDYAGSLTNLTQTTHVDLKTNTGIHVMEAGPQLLTGILDAIWANNPATYSTPRRGLRLSSFAAGGAFMQYDNESELPRWTLVLEVVRFN